MELIENIKKRFEYGEPYMEKLSSMPIKDIVAVMEKVWEGSCDNFYNSLSDGKYLKDAYNDKGIFVEYDSNFTIKKVKVSWAYWDCVYIELSAYGLVATYKPEHGSSKDIIDLTWGLVEHFFTELK